MTKDEFYNLKAGDKIYSIGNGLVRTVIEPPHPYMIGLNPVFRGATTPILYDYYAIYKKYVIDPREVKAFVQTCPFCRGLGKIKVDNLIN